MAYAFDEVRIDSGYGAVVKGGPGFSTAMISNPIGLRQANTNRSDALRKWTIDYGLLTITQLRSLYNFHLARFGMARGFRFSDPMENSATGSPGQRFASTDGVTTVFKLRIGGLTGRRIIKPVNGTVTIYRVDGATPSGLLLTTGFTIDYATGTVTFTVAPAAAGDLYWAGSFDIPVIFGSDDMSAAVDSAVSSEWNGIDLIELLPVTLGIT